MIEIGLTQSEADALIAMEKHRENDEEYEFPILGTMITIPVVSADKREHFLLDVRRGRIDIAKATYQNRARIVVVLVRLDLAGAPHRNPDDTELLCPHLHLYREDYGAKWAFPVPPSFADLTDPWRTLEDFMRYCNITKPPLMRRGLFT